MSKANDVDFDDLPAGSKFKFPYGAGEVYTKLERPILMGKGKIVVAHSGAGKDLTRDQIPKNRRVVPL